MSGAIVTEGRLVEGPCPDCDGVERRAFGEFESPRGDLASYAFGWTSGHEEIVGHVSVGLGVGNPGGGTFHCVAFEADGAYALSLVDEPFEVVPQGGPHLTRGEALAHGDLPFVWYVIDEVMAGDRRARWLTHWLLQTAAYATRAVVDGSAPVLDVVHDEDGDWQLFCDAPEPGEPHVFHLFHALDRDQSILDVLDLARGERAERAAPDTPWVRSAVTG